MAKCLLKWDLKLKLSGKQIMLLSMCNIITNIPFINLTACQSARSHHILDKYVFEKVVKSKQVQHKQDFERSKAVSKI